MSISWLLGFLFENWIKYVFSKFNVIRLSWNHLFIRLITMFNSDSRCVLLRLFISILVSSANIIGIAVGSTTIYNNRSEYLYSSHYYCIERPHICLKIKSLYNRIRKLDENVTVCVCVCSNRRQLNRSSFSLIFKIIVYMLDQWWATFWVVRAK